MKNTNYESPKFSFQEMKLLEKVADVCWGKSHHAWYDENKNGKWDAGEKDFYVEGSSCSEAGDLLAAKLKELGITFSPKDVAENVNSEIIQEIYS